MRATVLFLGTLLAASSAVAQQPADRWERYVAAFEEADLAAPQPKGEIVFAGSSTIHRWDTAAYFPDLKIYVDRKAPPDLRAAAQGLIAFVTLGVGMFIGSWVSGRIVDSFALPGGRHAWDRIWIMPAAGAAAVLFLFALFFRSAESESAAA